MGPWSYLFSFSSLALIIGLLIQWKVNQLPELASKLNEKYDYIIVGGGTAGCVLANRLSEDPSVTVLLLEAGQDDRDHPTVPVPIKSFDSAHSDIDWDLRTVPQKHALHAFTDQRAWWLSGKILGGTSNVNDMLYTRGLRQDYDSWAADGAKGWSYNDVLPYFLKSENNENADFVKSGYHQMGGPLRVGRSKTHSLTNYLVRAGKEMGYKIIDINGAETDGIVELQSTIHKGKRQSTSRAFLYPALSRPNLHVRTNSKVIKVVIVSHSAVAVVVQHNGTQETIRRGREIILSAGTVGSAKLLMLSGVGPEEHLRNVSVILKKDLPVGENLQDPMSFDFPVGIGRPFSITQEKLQSPWEQIKYKLVGKGMLASPNGVELATFTSSASNQDKSWPDLQLLFRGILAGQEYGQVWGFTNETLKDMSKREQYSHGMSCFSNILRPKSRGTLRLANSKPDKDPVIDPGYLQAEEDVEVLLSGIKLCKRLLDTPTMKQIEAVYAETPSSSACPGVKFDTDDFWRCMIRARAQPMGKPVGTCSIGSVTDYNLRVKGIHCLRVVDASVLPMSPSGGLSIPTIMVAEKAADLIKSVPYRN